MKIGTQCKQNKTENKMNKIIKALEKFLELKTAESLSTLTKSIITDSSNVEVSDGEVIDALVSICDSVERKDYDMVKYITYEWFGDEVRTITNIDWDLDEEDIDNNVVLPSTTSNIKIPGLIILDDIKEPGNDIIGEYISEYITNKYGFCHKGFKIEGEKNEEV